MSDRELSVTIRDDASPNLKTLTERMRQALRVVVARDTKELAARVRQKLSGEVLHIRSGALLRSIRSEMHEDASSVWGKVYSEGVVYAGIHEYGGVTSPHEIRPKNAKALHFFVGGDEVFAQVVHHPGSRMPERSYLRSSLAEMHDKIVRDIENAVQEEIKS